MKQVKPEPVVIDTRCSLCNEKWESHGDSPTTLDCIRLLRAELARRPQTWTINQTPPAPAVPMPWQTPVINRIASGSIVWRTPEEPAA